MLFYWRKQKKLNLTKKQKNGIVKFRKWLKTTTFVLKN